MEQQPNEKSTHERRTHRVRNSIGAIVIISAGITAVNYKTVEEVSQVVRGYFSKDPMDIPKIEGCEEFVSPPPPPSIIQELDATPSTTPQISAATEVPAPKTSLSYDAPETQMPPVLKAPNRDIKEALPDNVRSSARKSRILDLNPFEIVSQYSNYFEHEFARFTSPESGIEFRFFQYGEADGLRSFDAAAFSQAFHATLTIPTQPENPEVAHALDCMRDFFFGDSNGSGKQAEGYIMPIVIPDRPACVRGGKVVYSDCHSSGYAWPRTSVGFLMWDATPYDEFVLITTGSKFDEVSPNELYLSIAHEGAHKLREIAEGSYYSFSLDPEEGWAQHVEGLIKDKIPNNTGMVFSYNG
jgi:hypothetical protein